MAFALSAPPRCCFFAPSVLPLKWPCSVIANPKFGVYVVCVNICIIYTPDLGFATAVLGRERAQGRFRGSSEGAQESKRGESG